ncbi:MAG: hypothetical protein IKK96_00890 [Lachnospiraceae bacterium]|nr:hypothetical protein [Lachnospiraceae bacterium]
MGVLNLKQIELATEEDKEFKIDYWAKFFKAKTWEEIKMLAEKYPIIADAAVSIHEMTAEEKIRAICETRADYDRIERTWKLEIAELQEANDELQEQLNESNSEVSRLRAEIEALKAQLNK